MTDFVCLCLAGGGGGVDKMKGDSPRCNGASTDNGNSGYGGSQFQGGSGGKGAEEGDNNYSGGGGGGFETNGRSNQNFGGAKGTGGEGGKSFYKGSLGKAIEDTTPKINKKWLCTWKFLSPNIFKSFLRQPYLKNFVNV